MRMLNSIGTARALVREPAAVSDHFSLHQTTIIDRTNQ